MQTPVRLSLFVVSLLWLVGGCAPQAATTLAPHDEELLQLEQPEQIVPAKIGVEGRRQEVRVVLVPSYEEPELTAEEQEALGVEPDPINWLEFYVPTPMVTRVWPHFGGPHVGATGMAGAVRLVGPARIPMAAGPMHTGVVGAYPGEVRRASRATRAERAKAKAGTSSSAGVRIGEGPARRAVGRETRPPK